MELKKEQGGILVCVQVTPSMFHLNRREHGFVNSHSAACEEADAAGDGIRIAPPASSSVLLTIVLVVEEQGGDRGVHYAPVFRPLLFVGLIERRPPF